MRIFLYGPPAGDELAARLRFKLDGELDADYLAAGPSAVTPVSLRIRFIYPAAGRAVPIAEAGELDILAGDVIDALDGIAYISRRQVVAVHAAKEYGNVAGVEVQW